MNNGDEDSMKISYKLYRCLNISSRLQVFCILFGNNDILGFSMDWIHCSRWPVKSAGTPCVFILTYIYIYIYMFYVFICIYHCIMIWYDLICMQFFTAVYFIIYHKYYIMLSVTGLLRDYAWISCYFSCKLGCPNIITKRLTNGGEGI